MTAESPQGLARVPAAVPTTAGSLGSRYQAPGTDMGDPHVVASLAAWRKRGVQLSSLPMANAPPVSLTRIRTVASNGATMGSQVLPPSRVMVTVEPPLAQSPTTNRQAVSASTATTPTSSGAGTRDDDGVCVGVGAGDRALGRRGVTARGRPG